MMAADTRLLAVVEEMSGFDVQGALVVGHPMRK